MFLGQYATRFLFAALLLPLTASAWAVPLTGYIEGTAANGWHGTYAVQLTDGTVTSGTDQLSLSDNFSSLPLVTTGCVVSDSCVSVTNVATSTSFTMSTVILFLGGTATLGSLGNLSWETQPLRALPGNPSPTAAVLTQVSGTLGGTNLTTSSPFDFNGTVTATFNSMTRGQALSSVRIDFSNGTPPPVSQTLLEDNIVFIDIGVPVALGTPLAIPEPSVVLLLGLGLAGVLGWHWKQLRITRS